jgi:hypothetical protein
MKVEILAGRLHNAATLTVEEGGPRMAGVIERLRAKLVRWWNAQVIQEVPDTDALCEFDCRRLQCSQGEWESCERRIRRAAGELYPAPKVQPETPNPSLPVAEDAERELRPADKVS